MRRVTKYLIVNAEDGSARTVTRRPAPEFGELVYRLVINVPERWGQVMGDIELTLPEPPDDVGITEYDLEDGDG